MQVAAPPEEPPAHAPSRGTSALARRLGVRRHEPLPLPTLPAAATVRRDGAMPAAHGTSVLAQRLGLRRDTAPPPPAEKAAPPAAEASTPPAPAPVPRPSPDIALGPNRAPNGQRLFGLRPDMPRPVPPAPLARAMAETMPVPRPPPTRPSLQPLQPGQALPRMRPLPQPLPVPPRRRRRLLPALLVLALLAAAGAATAWRLHLLDRPAADGAVNAPRIAVASPADGRVTQVLVTAGAQVEAGTEMFVVDAPPPDQRRRADLATRLDNAHARADRLDRQITEMNGIVTDLKSRPTDPSSTRQQDDIRLRLIDTRAQRDSANSEAQALEQTIAAENTRPSGRQSVKAGSPGLVWSLAVTEAMEVSRGMPLAELADCTRLSVVVSGAPDGAKKLLPGQAVRLRITGFGEILPGTIRLGTGTMPRDEPAAAGNSGDSGAMIVELDQATQAKLKNSCPVGRTVSVYADGG